MSFRKKIYIILIISTIFRFGFFLFGDTLPVMWDARRYIGASIGLISYVDNSGDVDFQTPLQDRFRFKYYTDKYIQGEQIEWLKYKPFSLTEARNEIFIGGPLYPLLCSFIIYISPANDFAVIRVMNIIFDVFATLLLMLIAVKFIGKKGAVGAGLIYALYFPFTLLTSMMLLESSTTLLILLSIYYLLRATDESEESSITYYMIAGFTTGLLLLNKPTAMLLVVPFLFSFFWQTRNSISLKLFFKKVLYYLVPFLLIASCWMAVASSKYGELTLRDPSYKEANLRQSSNIMFEGYDLDKVEKDFWNYSISDHILFDKLGYVGLLVKKFERMWSRSANDFQKNYILSASIWEKVHLLLVLSGLFGLILLFVQNSRSALWIVLIVLYYTSIHIIFHSVSRYSFNALPLLFIASAYFFENVYRIFNSMNKKKILFALAGLLFVFVWQVGYINRIMQLTEINILLSVCILLLICFYSLFTISKLVLVKKSLSIRLLLPTLSVIIFIGCFYSTVLSRNAWSEFSCKLTDDTMKAGSRIFIESSDLQNEKGILAVLIDINSGANRENSFTVTIGDVAKEYVGGKPPLSDLFYPKPTYKAYAKYIPIGIEEFRQYAIIPVEYEIVQKQIAKNGFLDISIALQNEFDEKNNYITLYGNFDNNEEEHYIPGVRFTSVERHVHRGDPRIRYSVKYLSKKVISYYISRNSEIVVESTDLSPSAGQQTGRYNIFLVHFSPNGEFKVY